jgi:uncharacterized membrane protein
MLIFLAAFAATVVLASMAENIAELHYAPVYWRAVTSSSLPTSPFKNGGLNRLSANLNRPAVAKSP